MLSIRIVEGLDEAIDHINKFGSHHTDVICTSSFENSRKFIRNVDSASLWSILLLNLQMGSNMVRRRNRNFDR
ncbi:MAG: hypothetical protein Ct9H90mP27_0480 [Gammaproteobacteria bacterium]|nr:MAG: hypothetical protein Ct9H90mP27_0480 [Gammaproteobacteria bacterium]